MADDVDLQQEVLHKTLAEVAQDNDSATANPCVICLESISEPGIAVPCSHGNFDFLCLLSWLEQRHVCPLCKSDVTAVKYSLNDPRGPKTYHLPPAAAATAVVAGAPVPPHLDLRRGQRPRPPRRFPRSQRPIPRPEDADDPLWRRRQVYRNQLYSLRVGSNRLSRHRELTPQLFNRDEELVSRARKWIRRELGVFAFLNPGESVSAPGTPHGEQAQQQQRLNTRRANNAEFLLEYIIAILRTVDIKGSAGQAEELLRDFLGRENARLFLHELQAWLRSPYSSLEDWDRHVQYEDNRAFSTSSGLLSGSGMEYSRTAEVATPASGSDDGRGVVDASPTTGRRRRDVWKPRSHRVSPYRSGSQDELFLQRRLRRARDRYIPD